MATLTDYLIVPLFWGGAVLSAMALQHLGVPDLAVTPLVVGPMTGIAAVLERLRPERAEHRALDQPLWIEVAHFLFGMELGYGLALLACAAVQRVLPLSLWPSEWPTALQLLLALSFYEGTSYWQHRLIHRVPRLWRFHALHHSGARLNVVRTVRFHAIDFATASFAAYLPLVVLGASDRLFCLLGVLLSAFGILQHANIRMRTPAWLDWLLCTPAVHRLHHSRDLHESDHNFGNTLMIFDVVFGTYGRPRRPEGPHAVGIEDDPVPRGLWNQIATPLTLDPRSPSEPAWPTTRRTRADATAAR